MNAELFNYTKLAAYFIWDCTRDENALDLWYCAEDIACFFQQEGLLTLSAAQNLVCADKNSFEYIRFVRHLAYRLFVYTNRKDLNKNWYDVENLVCNNEWLNAIVAMANIYNDNKQSINRLGIRSEKIKEFYGLN